MNNSWKEELEKQLKAFIREQNEENMYNTRPLKSGFWPQIGFSFFWGGGIGKIILIFWRNVMQLISKLCETHNFVVNGPSEGKSSFMVQS